MKTEPLLDKTDNQIIAEFMDVEVFLINTVPYVMNPDNSGDKIEIFNWAKYDTSWDWLMPPFGKFASLEFEDKDRSFAHAFFVAIISEKILEVDIFQAHERLVTAINWYNQNKKVKAHEQTPLEAIVRLALQAKKHPMNCNMFDKPCDLLTCHTIAKCLWTKDEADKERSLAKTKKP